MDYSRILIIVLIRLITTYSLYSRKTQTSQNNRITWVLRSTRQVYPNIINYYTLLHPTRTIIFSTDFYLLFTEKPLTLFLSFCKVFYTHHFLTKPLFSIYTRISMCIFVRRREIVSNFVAWCLRLKVALGRERFKNSLSFARKLETVFAPLRNSDSL